MTIIEKVCALLGPTANDAHRLATIEALVEMCKQEAVDYCNLDEYTEKLDNAVVQMVIQRYNRLNNEGIDSTGASGISEHFHNGYTTDVLSNLRKHRRLKIVGSGSTNNSFNCSNGCGGVW